jgi:hypothetical protein
MIKNYRKPQPTQGQWPYSWPTHLPTQTEMREISLESGTAHRTPPSKPKRKCRKACRGILISIGVSSAIFVLIFLCLWATHKLNVVIPKHAKPTSTTVIVGKNGTIPKATSTRGETKRDYYHRVPCPVVVDNPYGLEVGFCYSDD